MSKRQSSTVTGAAPSLAKFYRWIPNAPAPMRADRSAAGTIPVRAYRYCEALCTASALGYYFFPAVNFNVVWDGVQFLWAAEGDEEYSVLEQGQAPGFEEYFDNAAPEDIRGFHPPLLTRGTMPGLLQMWSGWLGRTAPGYGLHVRGMINIPVRGRYFSYEGIIETDRWFGPIFINHQVLETDKPIHFRTDYPFLQAIPVKKEYYEESQFNRFELVQSLDDMTDNDWDEFRTTLVEPNMLQDRGFGHYASEVRKSRRRS